MFRLLKKEIRIAIPRKLTAVMFTDIAGYTRMMQTDEEEGLRVGAYYRNTLVETASLYNGKVLKHYGDGSFNFFERIQKAIQLRLLQREIRSLLGGDEAGFRHYYL